MKVFLNADVGEGAELDHEIIPLVQGVNISCGAHAGSPDNIKSAIQLALASQCQIGAHPGYPDPSNFGRADMQISQGELQQTLHQQLDHLNHLVEAYGGELAYIKPHGALYNQMAKNREFADVAFEILTAWKQIPIMMLAGSAGAQAALEKGIEVIAEGFLDRVYTDAGLLMPRAESGAILTDVDQIQRQVKAMILGQPFSSVSGKMIQVQVGSICVHSDTPKAVELLKSVLHKEVDNT